MIILNPENGTEIKKVYKDSVLYFEEGFKPDSIVKVDDEVGRFVLDLYGFLRELTKEGAIQYLNDKKNLKFKCPDCGIRFGAEKAFLEHKETHVLEQKLDDELGIPVIIGKGVKEEKEDTQKNIDSDLEKDGITGEGIRYENTKVKARF